jgi:hypothetical protein
MQQMTLTSSPPFSIQYYERFEKKVYDAGCQNEPAGSVAAAINLQRYTLLPCTFDLRG